MGSELSGFLKDVFSDGLLHDFVPVSGFFVGGDDGFAFDFDVDLDVGELGSLVYKLISLLFITRPNIQKTYGLLLLRNMPYKRLHIFNLILLSIQLHQIRIDNKRLPLILIRQNLKRMLKQISQLLLHIQNIRLQIPMSRFQILNTLTQQLFLLNILINIRTIILRLNIRLVNINDPMLALLSTGVRPVDLAVDANGFVTGQAVEFDLAFGVVLAHAELQGFVFKLHTGVLGHDCVQFFIRVELVEFFVAGAAEVEVVVFAVDDCDFVAVEVLAAEVLEVVDGGELEFDEDLGLDLEFVEDHVLVAVVSSALVEVFDDEGVIVVFDGSIDIVSVLGPLVLVVD